LGAEDVELFWQHGFLSFIVFAFLRWEIRENILKLVAGYDDLM